MEKTDNEVQYIVNTPFDGTIHTCVCNGKVYYSILSPKEYLDSKPGTRIITWAELKVEQEKYWTTSFQEITEEKWWSLYEQLPPVKPHSINQRYFVDYCSEAMSGSFHSIYLHDTHEDKFYTCTICINSSDDDILDKFKCEINP